MRERRYMPRTSKYVILFLAAASLATLLLGIYMTVENAAFKKKALETEAVITDAFVRRRSGSGKHSGKRHVCDAYMEYVIDGVTYNCTVDNYDRSYGYISESDYIGRTVILLYDPDDPTNARPADSRGVGVPLIAVGIITAGVCVFFYMQGNYYERLIKSGAVLDAVVVDVEHKTVVQYSRYEAFRDEEHYRILVCEWENPITKQKYIFRSKRIKEFVEPYVGQTVRVYADPKNYERYFVDVDDLLDKPFMNGKSKPFTYGNES